MVAITTADNPYDPFEQFIPWNLYDVQNHYNSCALLAEYAHTTDQMTDAEYAAEIERAIDEIVKTFGIHKKIVSSDSEKQK